MTVRITFLGGTQTVTGSKFLLETEETRILIDCGLFQGYKWLRERNWQPLPNSLDLTKLDAVILTHAHLDHSGYIPALYKQGYRGPIFAHPATIDLCSILLPDSGHIQEEDANFYSRHKISKHKKPLPLYDEALARASLELFQPLPFHKTLQIGDVKISTIAAGHILGAACIILETQGKHIGFSGDVGRPDDLFMRGAENLPELDLLMLESTYGNRVHEKEDAYEQLANVVIETIGRGGNLLIPSFAVGRAQLLQFMLAQMIEEGRIPNIPIFLDSPMAINVSEVYCNYPDLHRLTPEQCNKMSKYITNTRTVNESRELAEIQFPHIIIAGSGMATGGRALHHMKYMLENHRNSVLFAGYQSGGTRGAKMVGGCDSVKIHGKWLPIKAQIHMLEGLSAHADREQLLQWLQKSKLKPSTRIQLIHGEDDALEGMRDLLSEQTEFDTNIAEYRSIITV